MCYFENIIIKALKSHMNTYQGGWNKPTEKYFKKLNYWSKAWLEWFFREKFSHPDKYFCALHV